MTSPLAVLRTESPPTTYPRTLSNQDSDGWRLLAEASVLLSEADDIEELRAALFRVAVPQFADVCFVRLEADAGLEPNRLILSCPELAETLAPMAPPASVAPTTAIVAAIRSRGRSLGAVYFVTTRASRRRYRSEDLALAAELAHRVGNAVARVEQLELLRRAVCALRPSGSPALVR